MKYPLALGIAWLALCGLPAHADAPAPDGKTIDIGYTDSKLSLRLRLTPPAEDGWNGERNNLGATLTKKGKLPGENQQIEAYMMTLDAPSASMADYIDTIKANIQEGYASNKKYRLVSSDVQADPKDTRCARIHILLQDMQPPPGSDSANKKWSEQYTLSCGLTQVKRLGFEVRYYQRYYDPNKDERFAEKADRLFRSVTIEEKTVDGKQP